jgi:hypothetical protein
VLKEGFVNSVTSLHQFAEKMLEALQHMDHMDVEESHCSQDVIGYLLFIFNAAVFILCLSLVVRLI